MFTLLRGDCLSVLRTMPDESVHCAICSPPYFGLRNYGIPPTIWGGDLDCQHTFGPTTTLTKKITTGSGLAALGEQYRGGGKKQSTIEDVVAESTFCTCCGAWHGVLGLEPNLALHVQNLVAVFREVRRVLRRDGSCWVNYGDAYANDGKWGGEPSGKEGYRRDDATRRRTGRQDRKSGLPPKCRMMLPARLAIAMVDDGWTLRDEICWHKLNPMPTSVHDRTTPAHEMVYMFSKSARYFYDSFAIREPASSNTHARTGKIKAPDGWDTGAGAHGTIHRNGREKGKTVNLPGVTPKSAPEDDQFVRAKEGWHASTTSVLATRNKRSVWSIATEPSTDDSKHYAAYPTALVLPMIKAGTSEKGCCARCGAPWRRNTAHGDVVNPRKSGTSRASHVPDEHPHTAMREEGYPRNGHVIATTGWSPGCACDAPVVPCTVLDCFVGSGTTALVADRLGRHCIGIELSDEYADYAERRVMEDRGQLFDDRTAINAITPDGQAGLFDQAAE